MRSLLKLISIRALVAAFIWGLTGAANELWLNPLPLEMLIGSRLGNFVYDVITFELYEFIKEGILRLPVPAVIRRIVALAMLHLIRTVPYWAILITLRPDRPDLALRSALTVAIGSTMWWVGEEFFWDSWIRPLLSRRFPRTFRQSLNWRNRIQTWVNGSKKE